MVISNNQEQYIYTYEAPCVNVLFIEKMHEFHYLTGYLMS